MRFRSLDVPLTNRTGSSSGLSALCRVLLAAGQVSCSASVQSAGLGKPGAALQDTEHPHALVYGTNSTPISRCCCFTDMLEKVKFRNQQCNNEQTNRGLGRAKTFCYPKVTKFHSLERFKSSQISHGTHCHSKPYDSALRNSS